MKELISIIYGFESKLLLSFPFLAALALALEHQLKSLNMPEAKLDIGATKKMNYTLRSVDNGPIPGPQAKT